MWEVREKYGREKKGRFVGGKRWGRDGVEKG
jgi:hypothetical protein